MKQENTGSSLKNIALTNIATTIQNNKDSIYINDPVKFCAHRTTTGFCKRSNRQCPAINFKLSLTN